MKRFGFNSIVMEGESSQLTLSDLPFELRAMVNHHTPDRLLLSDSPSSHEHWGRKITGQIRSLLKKVNKRVPLGIKEFVGFMLFLRVYFLNSVLTPLRSIPKASLYYIHSPVLFPAVYFLSKKYKVPFIYDAHDFYSGIEKSNERSRMERRWYDPFYKKIEALCTSYAAAVVVTSGGLAKLQEHTFGVRPAVIRNCEDLRLVKEPAQNLREQIGVSRNDFLLVTIGQAKKGMAVRESLEALAALPHQVHLALLGRYYDQYLGDIRFFDLENRVHLVQPVKPFEVTSFVKSADASLMVYYARSVNYENFLPNGLFQSIAAQLPILYPELPEIKRIAEHYGLGIPIDPKSSKTIQDGVLTLLENTQLRSMLRENLIRANEELNWEKEEGILRDLVFDVIDSKTRQKSKGTI
jgi:glycosyltransferase involved in cell wall biosynthesis